MRIVRGVHAELEAAADELITNSLKGVTSRKAKSDILTKDKWLARKRREVLVSNGTPDRSLREGIFHRSWNPVHDHLNSASAISGKTAGRRLVRGRNYTTRSDD